MWRQFFSTAILSVSLKNWLPQLSTPKQTDAMCPTPSPPMVHTMSGSDYTVAFCQLPTLHNKQMQPALTPPHPHDTCAHREWQVALMQSTLSLSPLPHSTSPPSLYAYCECLWQCFRLFLNSPTSTPKQTDALYPYAHPTPPPHPHGCIP